MGGKVGLRAKPRNVPEKSMEVNRELYFLSCCFYNMRVHFCKDCGKTEVKKRCDKILNGKFKTEFCGQKDTKKQLVSRTVFYKVGKKLPNYDKKVNFL